MGEIWENWWGSSEGGEEEMPALQVVFSGYGIIVFVFSLRYVKKN